MNPMRTHESRLRLRPVLIASLATLAFALACMGADEQPSPPEPEPAEKATPEPEPEADVAEAPGPEAREIDPADLADMDAGELRLARNEIFARHGQVFKSEDLAQHFAQQAWYVPDPQFDAATLSTTEKYNVQVVKAAEQASATDGYSSLKRDPRAFWLTLHVAHALDDGEWTLHHVASPFHADEGFLSGGSREKNPDTAGYVRGRAYTRADLEPQWKKLFTGLDLNKGRVSCVETKPCETRADGTTQCQDSTHCSFQNGGKVWVFSSDSRGDYYLDGLWHVAD